MCGRLACYHPQEVICRALANQAKNIVKPSFVEIAGPTYVPSYNVSPSGAVLILLDKVHLNLTDSTESEYVIPMHWGLSDKLVDTEHPTFKNHNSRIETLMELQLPKIAMRKSRGVLVCDGYYEWQNFPKGAHQPYYFHIKTESSNKNEINPLMKLAVIFKRCVYQDKLQFCCSVITKPADKAISCIHHRMPINLNSFDAVKKWLDPNVSAEDSYEFLKTYDPTKNIEGDQSNALHYHKVSQKYVNFAGCNSYKCIESSDNMLQLHLDSWLTSGNLTKKRKVFE